jgi:ribosome-associated toxin RatA of RatAB toxin-antitoxin module
MSTRVERSVDIHMPVRTVYDQWTQFEDWPLFMDEVQRVEQLEDDEVRWQVKTRGVEREWIARITEQIPDKRIAWTSIEGPQHAGVVTFHRLRDDLTRVMLQLDFIPEGFLEGYADKMGTIDSWVEGELATFKEFLEDRGKPTGSWRGEIDHHAAEPETGTEVTADTSDDDDRRRVTDEQASTETTSNAAGTTEGTPSAEEVEHRAVDHREHESTRG